MNGRILVFNCHEAWVYQLRLLDKPLDIIVGLPGRHTARWDEALRPIPPKSRLVSLQEVTAAQETYDCIITHNLTDLLDAKKLHGPKLFVIHLTLAKGLRVSNYILRRARTLHWDFHQSAFAGIPITLVGHNPELSGVRASCDWSDLKQILSRHRFFVHTAHPKLEDGYNLATLEAMAAGLPVLSNRHPTSPITHGVDGFISDDPAELNAYARRLLADRESAGDVGQAARQTVAKAFSEQTFRAAMYSAIQAASPEMVRGKGQPSRIALITFFCRVWARSRFIRQSARMRLIPAFVGDGWLQKFNL